MLMGWPRLGSKQRILALVSSLSGPSLVAQCPSIPDHRFTERRYHPGPPNQGVAFGPPVPLLARALRPCPLQKEQSGRSLRG